MRTASPTSVRPKQGVGGRTLREPYQQRCQPDARGEQGSRLGYPGHAAGPTTRSAECGTGCQQQRDRRENG